MCVLSLRITAPNTPAAQQEHKNASRASLIFAIAAACDAADALFTRRTYISVLWRYANSLRLTLIAAKLNYEISTRAMRIKVAYVYVLTLDAWIWYRYFPSADICV